MKNAKWYLQCDIQSKTAVDLTQLPDVWNNITGFSGMNDDSVADLSWSLNPDVGFLTVEAAMAAGVEQLSIDAVIGVCKPAVDSWIRALRDPLLAATDIITTGDRWASLDAAAKGHVNNYRQALRDITLQDSLNVIWPAIPAELAFIRNIDLDSLPRPSESFVNAITGPAAVYSKAQLQDDQWMRIKAERDRRKNGGLRLSIEGKDYWFWTDDPSRAQYAMLADMVRRRALADNVVLDQWKTMDGTFVPFSVALLHSVIDAGIVSEGVLFRVAETKRQEMLLVEDPNTYVWNVSWPQTYDEYVRTIASPAP